MSWPLDMWWSWQCMWNKVRWGSVPVQVGWRACMPWVTVQPLFQWPCRYHVRVRLSRGRARQWHRQMCGGKILPLEQLSV